LGELRHESLKAVERRQIADKLGDELLLFDDSFGGPGLKRVLCEPTPGSPKRALQIGDSDIAVRRLQILAVEIQYLNHFGTPKCGFRLSSPVLSRVDTIALTTMSGWPFARNCARHSTELPGPLGLTSRVAV